jgi:hypothetical protein
MDAVMSQQLHGLRDYLGALEGAGGAGGEADDPADGEATIEAQIDALQDTE